MREKSFLSGGSSGKDHRTALASYPDSVMYYEDMLPRNKVLENECFVFTMPWPVRWPELLEIWA